MNIHAADFRALPGIPNCCPIFRDGSGGGAVGGLLVEFPLASSLLLSFHGGYVAHNALLTEREPVTTIVNGIGHNGTFEHRVDATISSIGLEPTLGLRLFDNFFVNAGMRGAFFLARKYAQEERTDVGTFLDASGADSHRSIRNASSGDLPNPSSILLQGLAGVGYEVPLNRRGTLMLAPEISYALAFTDVVKDVKWKANGLRLALALKYSPLARPAAYDTIVARDTATREIAWTLPARITMLERNSTTDDVESPDTVFHHTTIRERYQRDIPGPPPMSCTVTATGVENDGSQKPLAELRMEEFLSTTAHPLLNYIFFDRNSSELPSRYARLAPGAANGFNPEHLYGSGTLDIYYSMLNIIGKRLREYPRATLTLTGCNMDGEEEKGNLELSRKRAEAVRDYFTGVWGIDAARLKIEATNLPTKRSNPLTPDGQAEDRRVEIATNTPEVLDVFVANDTLRSPNPPIIRLFPVITSPRGISSWEITVEQRGTVLKQFSGSGDPSNSMDWDLVNDQAHAPRYSEPLVITLHATSPSGDATTCRLDLPTRATTIQQKREHRVGDFTIDRYNLILFNVGESGITSANGRVIDRVKGKLKPESEVTIEGFADRTGNAAGNQKLSATRAAAAATAMGRPDATTRGIGESRLLYTNDVPEGRFYCRTVQILVKTPIAW
ncbi:MAG: OmpA family protein [Candidatus Kapaibacterium sp.]